MTTTRPITTSMEHLFPQQILDAIGGPHVMEKLEKIREVPDYAPNLDNLRWKRNSLGERVRIIEVPKGPAIKRGCDAEGRPFLEVYVPGYQPLVYHTYSTCKSAADFTRLENWEAGSISNSTSLAMTIYNFSANALSLLSQIMKGEDCRDMRGRLYRY